MFQLSLTGQYSRRALHYVNASMLYLMNFAYVSFALCNALGCIWYFTAVTEGIEKSWLSSIGAQCMPARVCRPAAAYVAAMRLRTEHSLRCGAGSSGISLVNASSIDQYVACALSYATLRAMCDIVTTDSGLSIACVQPFILL